MGERVKRKNEIMFSIIDIFVHKKSWWRFFQRLLLYALVITACLVTLFPFYWMVVTSMQPREKLFTMPPPLVPETCDFTGYSKVVTTTSLFQWLSNSLIVSIAATACCTVLSVSGAYALSRLRFWGRSIIGFSILMTQMIPPVITLVSLYLIFRNIGLLNSLTGLIIGNVGFAIPICVWLLKGIFDAIPTEIEEAAIVDGCSRMGVLWRIILPLSLPGIAAVAILSFMWSWDEFMLARTVISTESNWVGSLGIISFIGLYITPWNQIMAAATIFTIPAIVLFIIVQKWFISGLTTGAVKG